MKIKRDRKYKKTSVQCQSCFSWYYCCIEDATDLCECPHCKSGGVK